MKKRILLLILSFHFFSLQAQVGNVGINTNTPLALLHVKDSSVLFSGPFSLPSNPGDPPVSGPGIRLMWYSSKAAFRAGRVISDQWDKLKIGDNSFASGLSTEASGNSSFAMGETSKATGLASFAAGFTSTAEGSASFALGAGAKATGFVSFAAGNSTEASGQRSSAFGFLTTASGSSSTAFGANSHAAGAISFAFGSSTATGGYSTSMGLLTRARAYASVVLGQYNDSIASSDPLVWDPIDPVFIIGNGTSNSVRKNAITILKNAKTGINTSAPLAGLHIVAVDNSFDQSIRLESTLGPTSFCNILYDGSLKFRTSEATATYQWRDNTNNTRMSLTSAGNLSIDGVLSQSSDRNLKTNIIPLQNSLAKISSLNGYQYNWRDPSRGKDLQAGVLAQEVEKQMPELVIQGAEGDKAVNYSGLIPYLIESVKELKQQNEELRKEIELLKAKRQ